MQIRTGMRSSWLAAAAAVLVTGLLALLPSGCGSGGDGGTSPTPSPTPGGATPSPTPLRTAAFKVKIDWGARSRVVGLSSALSARITLEKGDASGNDISWVVNRPAGTAAVLQSYDSPRPARVGQSILTIRFYAAGDAGGEEIGRAEASASVLADGSLTVTISTYTGVQSIVLLPGQSVNVGETKDLKFAAKNFNGQDVAITNELRGGAFFTVVADPQNLESVNGGSQVKGLHPIQATVTVRVDTATSAPVVVSVKSPTTVAVTPPTGDIGSEYPLDLSAVVDNVPIVDERDVIWTIEGGASTTNGQLVSVAPNTVTYVAPKLVGTESRTVRVIATSRYDTTITFAVPIKVSATTAVEMTPDKADLTWEQTIPISALVKNLSVRIPATGDSRREVKWEIVKDGNNPVGTLTVDANDANKITYTAPKRDITTPILVRAISNYDSTKVGVCTINVISRVAVDITPKPVGILNWADQVDLTAAVAETPNQAVTWTITSPSGFAGAIVSTGTSTARFTAPKADGDYTVRATSNYDTRKFQEITFKVDSKAKVSIARNPIGSLNWEDFTNLTATVIDAPDTSVTWSIRTPTGFASSLVTTSPTTARFTAPKVDGTYIIRATSNFDTRQFNEVSVDVKSTTTVAVTPKPIATQQWEDVVDLSALVQNAKNNSVTWTVEPAAFQSRLSSITATTARFTAPKLNGTYVVRATSNYDDRVSDTVSITVDTRIGVVILSPDLAGNSVTNPLKVSINRVQNLTAGLTGLPPGRDSTIEWTILGPNDEPNTGGRYGSIPGSGNTVGYRAPANVPAPEGKLKVIANSKYDPNAKRTIIVQVIAGSLGIGIK